MPPLLKRASLLLAISGALWLAPASLYANKDAEKRQAAVAKQIDLVIQELQAEKNRYSELEKKLQDVEKRIQFQSRTLRKLEEQITKGAARITQLQADQKEQRYALSDQQRLLAKQLRAAWMTGNQEQLQLWLSGRDVKMFGPVLTWYEYVSKSRADNVIDLSAELELLAKTEQELQEATEALRVLRDSEQQNVGRLDAAREQRASLLASSGKRIKAEENQLQKLKQEEAELAALIKKLKLAAARAPKPVKPAVPSKPFAKLTGKLHWPVKGRIQHDYGAPRADGRLKWNGVTIKAKRGSKVRSVAGGEVIFADWLGRLGLLLIVDHGDNYLTLYGHNQALYKKPGEKVSAGDLIASVGDSGGRTESALYFEVRKGSQFRNPHLWCKKAAL